MEDPQLPQEDALKAEVNSAQDQAPPEEPQPPAPMARRPVLQALAWVGGIAAGGAAVMVVLGLIPSRTRGASHAVHARWQLERHGPAQVEQTQEPTAAPDDPGGHPAEGGAGHDGQH